MKNWRGGLLVGGVLLAGGLAAVDPHALTQIAEGDVASVMSAPWSGDSPARATAAPKATAAAEPTKTPAPAATKKVKRAKPAGPALTTYLDKHQVDSDLAAFAEKLAGRTTVQRVASGPTEFRLATFNTLGAVHTEPGADADEYAPWRMRAEWTGTYIQQRQFDIVGLQEIEARQYSALMRATNDEFEGWPGLDLPKRAVQTSVIWRKDRFEAVKKSTLTIDFMSYQQPIPVVELRDLHTQKTFWVINVHNAPRSWESQRDAATRDEIALVNQLRGAGETVFLFGDTNERDETACTVFAKTDLVSPAGGSNNGRCILPANHRIDWIFGPPEVTYSGYVLDRSALVAQSTDHFVPQTKVTIQ